MKLEKLKKLLQFLFDGTTVGATLYFIIKQQGEMLVRRADIKESDQPELLNGFREKIKEDILENEDLSLLNISSADDRKNVIYRYDLDEPPAELGVIDSILQAKKETPFSFSKNRLTDIYAIVVLIGNHEHQLALYKKNYPVSLLKKETLAFIKGAKNRLKRLEDDILKLNNSYDFFKIKNNLFINKLSVMEKFFSFHAIIQKNARISISVIEKIDLLENANLLVEGMEDISFSRKLTKIATDSPVVKKKIPNSIVIKFTKTFPSLVGKFKYTEDGKKIVLKTKKSRNYFVKLLNDDFLTSELTSEFYESRAKDKLESE